MGPTAADVELVIFDCDGVLVDSEVVSVRVMGRVLAELGWQLTAEEIVERFVGGSKQHFDAQVFEYLGRSLPDGWADPYSAWYEEAFKRELRAVSGVEQAIDSLQVATCVASNSSHSRVRASLEIAGLIDRFDGRIFSAQDVAHPKPAPDVYLHAAREMGVPVERCVVVEDSRYGAQAARAAGMRVLGYAGGLTPAAWLEGERTTVFMSMDQLPGLVRG
ncbi:MAG TPA: HAD family hydrolase [Microbacteriaceae bacterium]|jgi:HAD superfamily hydrolase (TIGR01509 family)|nr:HAD family hydrolase [Microbacteriaceae bacterium]